MTTKTLSPLRPAGAAIAAVLAFSSTAVLAQDAGPQTAPAPLPAPLTAPSIVPANAPVASPVTAARSAPAPSTDILRSATTTAPANPNANPTSNPTPPTVVTRPTLPAVEPVPQARRAPVERPVAQAAPAPRAASRPVPEPAPMAAAPLPAPIAAPVADNAAMPAPLPTPLDEPVIDSLPVEQDGMTPVAATDSDGSLAEWALFGGLVGIGGIAAAAALTRRRHPQPQPDPFMTHESTVSRTPTPLPRPDAQPRSMASLGVNSPSVTVPGTAASATVLRAPVYASRRHESARPASAIGRHEAMVDAGPTPDNPFLTRRKRLTRARFLDRQEAAAQQSGLADLQAAPARYAAIR